MSASSQEFKERPFIIKLEHNVLHPLTYDLIDLVPFLGFLSGSPSFYVLMNSPSSSAISLVG